MGLFSRGRQRALEPIPVDVSGVLAESDVAVQELRVHEGHEDFPDAIDRHHEATRGVVVGSAGGETGDHPLSSSSLQMQDVAATRAGVVAAASEPMGWDSSASKLIAKLWVADEAGTDSLVNPGQVMSIDIACDGSRTVILAWEGHGVLYLLDTGSGELRELTALTSLGGAGLLGNEVVRWSPDDRWLLVSGNHGAVLVDPASGSTAALPLPEGNNGAAWWTVGGAVNLMGWRWSEGTTELFRLALTSAELTPAGTVSLPANDLPEDARIVMDLAPEPEGQALLCTTFLGTSHDHRERFACSERRARGRVTEPGAVVEFISPPFPLGTASLEARHRGVRWIRPAQPRPPIDVHPSLRP